MGVRCFLHLFFLTSHFPTLIGLAINHIHFPKFSLFCLQQYLVSDLPVLILTHDGFLSPCTFEEGERQSSLVGTWQPAKVNLPQHVPEKLALGEPA